MKRSLILTGIAWTLWLAIQHASWLLNFGTDQMNLSQANGVCSLARQYPYVAGVPAVCSTVSDWWTISTLLFWFGFGALVAFVFFLIRHLQARAS